MKRLLKRLQSGLIDGLEGPEDAEPCTNYNIEWQKSDGKPLRQQLRDSGGDEGKSHRRASVPFAVTTPFAGEILLRERSRPR